MKTSTAATLLAMMAAVTTVPLATAATALELVRAGQPTGTIVIPDEPLPPVRFAAAELQYHVREATGATLPIRSEGGMDPGASGILYLGACTRTASVGLHSEGLPPNGFHIKLIADNLFFLGDDSDGAVLESRGIAGSLHDNKTRVGTLFAVYEFLDHHMGVRWLWPGKLGEVIPRQQDLAVHAWDETYHPVLLHTRLRDYYSKRLPEWSSPKVADNYYRDQAIWLRRHRFAQGIDLDYGHAFHDYWEQYGAEYPVKPPVSGHWFGG